MARTKTKLPQRKAQKAFPIWLIVAGITLLLLVAVWALVNTGGGDRAGIEVTGAPAIKVDQEVQDYGEVKLGEKPIRSVVKVTNVGDQPLRFTEEPYIEVLEGC